MDHNTDVYILYMVKRMPLQISSRVGVQYNANSTELHKPLSDEVLQDSRVVELLRPWKQTE